MLYADQWDNLANRQAHIDGTGPEIWAQVPPQLAHAVGPSVLHYAAARGATPVHSTARPLRARPPLLASCFQRSAATPRWSAPPPGPLQTGGEVDAFCCAMGTGGTLAGVGAALRAASGGRVVVALTDPEGAALVRWFNGPGRLGAV